MRIALGIDTGGTYTDAVLVKQDDGEVLASAKALTTRRDLSVGIGKAVAEVFTRTAISPDAIDLVGLSTTLATNAIVEGEGYPVCLLLIGYDPSLIRQYGFERELATSNVVYIQGGHDSVGNEVAPLDESAAREAILMYRDQVDAFAISSYFSVRNPDHEVRARALVKTLTAQEGHAALPVTCGHELTTRLNAVKRATTVALNARLIPLLRDLINTVQHTLTAQGIRAPLMIVKGDGSLVRAAWALHRPIETILSGPAASVVGAWHLAGQRDVWVVDVGGTTTDIAVLRDGRPRLNPQGAQVGSWRTMVEAVDVHTVGLGGDSRVCLNGGPDGLSIGPQRVVPLALLAHEYPETTAILRRQVTHTKHDLLLDGQFLLLQRHPASALSERDQALIRRLEDGPVAVRALADEAQYEQLCLRRIKSLETRQIVQRAAFTPTDALHVLGKFQPWDVEAARLGATLLADQARLAVKEFCACVVSTVSDNVTTALVSKSLGNGGALPNWEHEPTASALLASALTTCTSCASDLGCALTLGRPIVAVGAPVEAYLPRSTQQLHTNLIIPPHADVANATGAVAGGVVQSLRALVRPVEFGTFFRLYLPDTVRDFDTVEAAVAYAHQTIPDQVTHLAHQAGAEHVELRVTCEDQTMTPDDGEGQEVYLETVLIFTAIGRPSLAQESQ